VEDPSQSQWKNFMQHPLIPNMRFIRDSASVPFLLFLKPNSIKEILKKIV
jgi:hypothetical protein